jgi:hypothetical protein
MWSPGNARRRCIRRPTPSRGGAGGVGPRKRGRRGARHEAARRGAAEQGGGLRGVPTCRTPEAGSRAAAAPRRSAAGRGRRTRAAGPAAGGFPGSLSRFAARARVCARCMSWCARCMSWSACARSEAAAAPGAEAAQIGVPAPAGTQMQCWQGGRGRATDPGGEQRVGGQQALRQRRARIWAAGGAARGPRGRARVRVLGREGKQGWLAAAQGQRAGGGPGSSSEVEALSCFGQGGGRGKMSREK